MSYDLRLGVKVQGAEDLYAVIDEPELSSPTYNIGAMLRACTGWDFNQGEWYNAVEVLPLIQHGINELKFHERNYRKGDSHRKHAHLGRFCRRGIKSLSQGDAKSGNTDRKKT